MYINRYYIKKIVKILVCIKTQKLIECIILVLINQNWINWINWNWSKPRMWSLKQSPGSEMIYSPARDKLFHSHKCTMNYIDSIFLARESARLSLIVSDCDI